MRMKQTDKEIKKELIDIITDLKGFYNLGEAMLITSKGGIFPNKALPSETALALLYANLELLYKLILRSNSGRDLTWMEKHMDNCISFIKQQIITQYLNKKNEEE